MNLRDGSLVKTKCMFRVISFTKVMYTRNPISVLSSQASYGNSVLENKGDVFNFHVRVELFYLF